MCQKPRVPWLPSQPHLAKNVRQHLSHTPGVRMPGHLTRHRRKVVTKQQLPESFHLAQNGYEAEGGKGRQRKRILFWGVSKFVKAGLGENNKTSTCWEDLLAQGLKRRGSRATRRIEVEDLHPSVGSMRQQRDVQRNDFP